MIYLHRKVSGRPTVGYFTRRTWRQESVHWSAASAADRAVYLNGGTTEWSRVPQNNQVTP